MTVETSMEIDELYSVLAHPWRRYTLSLLLDDRRQATLHQLAERIAENESEDIDIDRIKILLHHDHLPRLDAAELVTYDTTTNHVEANSTLETDGVLDEALSLDTTSTAGDTT